MGSWTTFLKSLTDIFKVKEIRITWTLPTFSKRNEFKSVACKESAYRQTAGMDLPISRKKARKIDGIGG